MASLLVAVAFLTWRSSLFAFQFAPSQPADLEHTLISIQESIEAGNLDVARHSIARALERHPNAAGVLNLRGVVNAKEQKLAAARADFERAVHLDAHLTPAWQNLARACQLLASSDGSAISCAINAWSRVLLDR